MPNLASISTSDRVVFEVPRKAGGHPRTVLAVLAALGLGRLAGQLVLRDELRHQQQVVLEQARADVAAAARARTVVQRGQRADHAEGAAQDVVGRGRDAARRARRAVDVGQAAHHLHHLVECRALLVRAGQEALERDVDEPRVLGRQRGVVQPVLGEAAVAEVLQQHVGL